MLTRRARSIGTLVGLLLGATSLARCATAGHSAVTPATDTLQSFYLQSLVDGGNEIVEVQSRGRDVRVRTISVVAANEWCPGVVVRAYDRLLTNTSVESVAGVPLCSWSEQYVDRTLHDARRVAEETIDWFGWRGSVVAACGDTERRFLVEQSPNAVIDDRKLGRANRDLLRMWNLLRDASPGGNVGPESGPPPTIEGQEALGTTVVPDLINGRFETAFRDACWDDTTKRGVACSPNYFAWVLEHYAGPPAQRGPLPPELLDRDSLRFEQYVEPQFSTIALAARLYGDVRLRLAVESATGIVRQVDLIDGSTLLADSARVAARQWRFVPGTVPAQGVVVTVRFQLRCPGQDVLH